MELRVLQYFLTIAREESFTKAAEQLHLTQPTLSRQIAQLEEELGVTLFHRSRHKVILTEDGLLLRRRAEEMMSLAEKTKQDFAHREENLEGSIAIGCGEFLATRVLTDCIAAFHEKFPHVRYELHSGNAIETREEIERGILDVGLISEPVEVSSYESISMPIEEEWGVLVQTDDPLAQKQAVTPLDLAGKTLISTRNESAQIRLRRWMGEYADSVDVIARGNLLYNEALMGQSGVGLVIGIRHACQYDGLQFLPFDPPMKSGTALVWKKGKMMSAAVSAFVRFARKKLQ